MVGPTRDLALGTSFSTNQVVPGTTTDYTTLDLAKYIASESLKKPGTTYTTVPAGMIPGTR